MNGAAATILPFDTATLGWARAALAKAETTLDDPEMRARWLRHGATWFVGVNALANGADGSVDGTALPARLAGLWQGPWHQAQISAIYAGYPKQDTGETDAAYRYRRDRDGAHVDGLHLDAGRRILREAHGFILGIPLTNSDQSPLVVWDGSHRIMAAALAGARLGSVVTDAYHRARRDVFEHCERQELQLKPGQAVLLHRLALHGIAPWQDDDEDAPRIVAYFRPEIQDDATWATL